MNRWHAESGPQQPAKSARGFFVIGGLLQTFALQVGVRQLFFIDGGVSFIHHFFDYVLVYAFHFQISDYSTATKFFIVATKRRVRCGILSVVEIALVLQTPDDEFDQHAPDLCVRVGMLAKQPLQFSYRTHPPPKRADCILVQLGFAVVLAACKTHGCYTLAAD